MKEYVAVAGYVNMVIDSEKPFADKLNQYYQEGWAPVRHTLVVLTTSNNGLQKAVMTLVREKPPTSE